MQGRTVAVDYSDLIDALDDALDEARASAESEGRTLGRLEARVEAAIKRYGFAEVDDARDGEGE